MKLVDCNSNRTVPINLVSNLGWLAVRTVNNGSVYYTDDEKFIKQFGLEDWKDSNGLVTFAIELTDRETTEILQRIHDIHARIQDILKEHKDLNDLFLVSQQQRARAQKKDLEAHV